MGEGGLFEELPVEVKPVEPPRPREISLYTRFIVDGEPVPKGRARAYRAGNIIKHYSPPETVQYEQRVKQAARRAIGGVDPLDNRPLAVMVYAYERIPTSWSKKKQEAARRDEIRPQGHPDADNYLKIVCDGCNGVVWRDDALVTDMLVGKRYSDRPRMEVEIYV